MPNGDNGPDNTRLSAEKFYRSIKEIYCPYPKDRVLFNAKGLNHIRFKAWDRQRNTQDQYMRLRLLRIAPQIISQSHTLQEYLETKGFERQKINSRWEKRLVNIKYYSFIAIINDYRAKVIVKEIKGSEKFFWSLIPLTKMKKKSDSENKRILHEGNPETQ